jgi:hypothetical protein
MIMDFKSLISKLDSMDAPPTTPKAPELPKTVQLDEDHALKVLAGTITLSEAAELMEKKLTKAEKEKKEEVVKSMKNDKADFKERYGKRGEEVMHATATKIAKKKAEGVESNETQIAEDGEMKVGDTKKTSTGGTLTKTATGVKHKAKDWDGEDHTEPAQSKASKAGMTGAERREQKVADKEQEKSSKDWEQRFGKGSVTRHKMKDDIQIDSEKFLNKFMEMVEEAKKAEKKMKGKKAEEKMDEAKKPDDDNDGVPNWADEKPGEDDNAGKKKSGKKGMSDKQAKYFGKKTESVEESEEMKTGDKKSSSTGGTIEKTKTGLKHTAGKNYSGKAADADKKKTDESKMMPKGKKRPVKESVESKLSFREMMKLVVESGGQQQIDPLDKELFAWATRMAKTKLGEGMKAEVYAGMVYERMGGVFEIYDVLAEDQK